MRGSPFAKLAAVLLALAAVTAVGVAGYTWIEGWSAFDALYMTVITLGTIGYGETHPLSHPGRVFTIFLILSGLSVFAYGFSALTAFFVEGKLSDALRRSRMQSKIDAMKGHYILCGGGHTGRVILQELQATGRPVVVVEKDAEAHAKLLEAGVLSVHGDATEDDTLKKAGVERAAGIFAALGNDRDNAFIALTARGLNATVRIVAEQLEKGVEDKLRRSGADVVVRPTRIGGLRMASEMVRPAVVTFLDGMLRDDKSAYRFEEVPVPATCRLIGLPMRDLFEKKVRGALLVAVRPSAGSSFEFNPDRDRPIGGGEVLVVMAEPEQARRLAEVLAS